MTAHTVKVWLVQLAALAALFGVWLYATGPGGASQIVLPTVSAVARELWAFLQTSELYSAIWVTVEQLVVALAIAVVAGLAVGFWAARGPLRSRVVEPLLVWTYQIPMILFYPLFLLWLGFGSWSKIGYAAASSFLPIAFNSLRAFASVDPKYVRMGRAFGGSPRQVDLTIKFRAGLPLAAAGIKLGTAICVVTVIVAEMLGSTEGLGYLITFNSESFDSAKTYAIIVIVLAVVAVFYELSQLLLRDRTEARRR